jgi:hypothetical protein
VSAKFRLDKQPTFDTNKTMKKNTITLEEFKSIIDVQPAKHQRLGQAMWNKFYDVLPYLYSEVDNSAIDTFYDDSKIPAFVKWLSEKIALQPSLPEGFTPWEATEKSECPCHPEDEIVVCRQIDGGIPLSYSAKASRINWKSSAGRTQIIGYKIEKKYVEPRPMKYSEIPVGQVFVWGDSRDNIYKDEIFMKTDSKEENSLGERLNSVEIVGIRKGRISLFMDSDNVLYFEASLDGKIGGLLTVQE